MIIEENDDKFFVGSLQKEFDKFLQQKRFFHRGNFISETLPFLS